MVLPYQGPGLVLPMISSGLGHVFFLFNVVLTTLALDFHLNSRHDLDPVSIAMLNFYYTDIVTFVNE